MNDGPATLRRSISFPLLMLYGVGTTVGAGIYALTGKVAGEAGGAAPFSFLLASVFAGLSAASFAELSSRYPRSAGEAVYVREAFARPRLASVVGLMVATSGCVSAATITTGFAGYLGGLVDVPRSLAIVAGVAALILIAAWGVKQSLWIAGLITLIEIGGLVLVCWSARASLAELPLRFGELLPSAPGNSWAGIAGGALLSFYAFLGFEDMVNVAEEVKDVRRNMPRAIFATLLITSILYMAVTSAAVLSVSPSDLAKSEEPLALIVRESGGGSSEWISLIAILAMLNGALIQIVMASRVLYGLSGEPFVSRAFGRVSARTGTPIRATAVAGAVVLGLALAVPLRDLAAVTSLITLLVFAVVNLSLVRIRLVERDTEPASRLPLWMPILGFVSTLSFFGYSSIRWLLGGF